MGIGRDSNTISAEDAARTKENGSSSDAIASEMTSDSVSNENYETKKEMKNEDEKSPRVPFYKLFAFADSIDIILMILGTLGALGNGISSPLMTVLLANLIQSFGGILDIDEVLREITKIVLEFVYLAIGSAIASFLEVACWTATAERQAARIRNLYLKTILRQDIAFFDKETNTGEVIGRMSGDTILIQDAMGEKAAKFIQIMTTFVGGFAIAFIQGWLLTLVMLATIPPLALAGSIMSNYLAKTARRSQEAYGKAATVVEQTISSIRTVASFTGERLAITSYEKSLVGAYKASVQQGFVSGIGIGAILFFMFGGYSLAIWYGSRLILDKGYNGGRIINVIFAIVTSSYSLGQVAPCISSFAAAQSAAYKMFETINRKSEIDSYDKKGKKLDDIQGDIEFKDVYFSYPTRPDEQIFRGFSLSIQKGTTVALVGESGSGKSTVISLIERFYDPQSGEILIDGINLKEFHLRWIRGKIGLVSQEPVLFSTSIRDNITYAKDNATAEEIRVAMEVANAAKFIDKLPQGIDTLVGEHGIQLSGGQKQRVAIARAILKDPRILLLDEATSALDAESEQVVQEALDRVMENRTTVVVAHRLSTVRNANSIAVIHRGSIVEKGSHVELLNNQDGAYFQLIRLQEMNRDSDTMVADNEKYNTSTDFVPSSSKTLSFQRSVSRGSSMGHTSRRSYGESLGFPTGTELNGTTLEKVDTEVPKEPQQKPSLHRLAAMNKPEIPILLLGTVAAIATGVILPVYGLLLSRIIKTFYEPDADKLRKDSNFWSVIFLVFAVEALFAVPATSYLFGLAGSKLIRRVRLMTFQKVINMEIAWFDDPENSSGSIGARLSTDAANVKGLVGDSLSLIVQNITTLITGLLIAFISNWMLSLIILALVPLLGLNGWIQVKFMKGFSADAKSLYVEASQIAHDAVGSIRTVASFSAEDKVLEMYKQRCALPKRKGIMHGIISGIGFGVSFLLLYCAYAVSFYAGAQLVNKGKTTFVNVFQVFFALAMAATSVSHTSTFAPDSSKANDAAASIFVILDRKSEIDPQDTSGLTIERLKGNIEFQHVSFSYPTRPDILILQDLSLTIHSGKTVALVGESGSGKSTVISLLQRFYNPNSGQIFLDGIEIQKLQLKWLRQQMGLVSQEPSLFNDTIRANIAYGKEGNATEAEIIAASELANAHKFISSMQKGYDTVVGERGLQLSGGQKQRIAIARAILKDPKILLLDEATSALDAESERVVQDALDHVMMNRTTVIIAHRLSTIKDADVIAVVKNGAIIEEGKHETLINITDGAYSSLVALHMSAAT